MPATSVQCALNGIIAAYIDYSKAFDTVCHSKLLAKLAALGTGGNLLSGYRTS